MVEDLVTSIGIILLSYVLAIVFTALTRRVLLQHAVLDRPNDRSSHKVPVPRGGGWALLAVLVPGMALTAFVQNNLPAHGWLIAAVILLAAVSWLDDRKGVKPAIRLGVHLLAAFLGSLSLPEGSALFGDALPFWLDRAVMVVGWAWFVNLYNFMDGIDGITGTETVAIATGTCIVFGAVNIDDPFVSVLTLLLTGACLGFLALNWHPAKIFLGDVGSVPLGFLAGYALLALAVRGHLAAALILPLYYLTDSGITLAKRALKGEKIWQAHRQHFYQQAAQGLGRHDRIVIWIAIAGLFLIGAAVTATINGWAGLALGVAIVAILLRKMHKAGATRTA